MNTDAAPVVQANLCPSELIPTGCSSDRQGSPRVVRRNAAFLGSTKDVASNISKMQREKEDCFVGRSDTNTILIKGSSDPCSCSETSSNERRQPMEKDPAEGQAPRDVSSDEGHHNDHESIGVSTNMNNNFLASSTTTKALTNPRPVSHSLQGKDPGAPSPKNASPPQKRAWKTSQARSYFVPVASFDSGFDERAEMPLQLESTPNGSFWKTTKSKSRFVKVTSFDDDSVLNFPQGDTEDDEQENSGQAAATKTHPEISSNDDDDWTESETLSMQSDELRNEDTRNDESYRTIDKNMSHLERALLKIDGSLTETGLKLTNHTNHTSDAILLKSESSLRRHIPSVSSMGIGVVLRKTEEGHHYYEFCIDHSKSESTIRPTDSTARKMVTAPVKKEILWEKPDWASRSVLKPTGFGETLMAIGNLAKPISCPVYTGQDKCVVLAQHVLSRRVERKERKHISWEKPSWTEATVLKPTEKGDVLREKGNLAKPLSLPGGDESGMNKHAQPEQVLKRKGCCVAAKKYEDIRWEKPLWATADRAATLKMTDTGLALQP
jgi:hypothetical protein